MKVFLRKLFLFLCFLLFLAGLLVGIASIYMNSEKIVIQKQKNILVIGDSHTECSIDDSSFKRASNFSKSATSFVYSYASLRKLIHDNPHIDTVLLSYHSSSLLYERERNWIFDEATMNKQVPVFLPYFSASEFGLFLFKPHFYKAALQTFLTTIDYRSEVRKGSRQEWIDKHMGDFRDLTWSNFSKDTAASKPLTDYTKRDTVSKISIDYILKFNKFCKKSNIVLILFNSPVYQWKQYANFVEFNENRQRYFKDILFLDYAEHPIADSCRFDIWHLNGVGAREFSKYLDANFNVDISKCKQEISLAAEN